MRLNFVMLANRWQKLASIAISTIYFSIGVYEPYASHSKRTSIESPEFLREMGNGIPVPVSTYSLYTKFVTNYR